VLCLCWFVVGVLVVVLGVLLGVVGVVWGGGGGGGGGQPFGITWFLSDQPN